MTNRKTQRKNKTKQIVTWPSNDTYFTIDSLVQSNPHMLTSSTSDITLRVRLNKAITEEPFQVAVIGQKNRGKGRPQLVFAMRPVRQSVIDKAKADGIYVDETKLITVMEVTGQQNQPMVVTPVKNIAVNKTVTA